MNMETKKELRKIMLSIRKKMSKEDVENNSRKIWEKIFNLEIYSKSKVIFIYLDFNNEVMTFPYIKRMLDEGKRLVVPYTDMVNEVLILSEISNEKDLALNPFGYYEPEEPTPVPVEDIDLVIVPGVVFDEKLNRVGFGKGYYDKILHRLSPHAKKIAVAHDFQVLDSVPSEEHDVKMDILITEKRVISSDAKSL